MHILNHVIWEIRLGQEIRKLVYMHCNNLVSGYRKTSHFNLFGQRWAYFKWIGEIWLCRLKNFNQAASERKVSVVRHKQFFSLLCPCVWILQKADCWVLRTDLFILADFSFSLCWRDLLFQIQCSFLFILLHCCHNNISPLWSLSHAHFLW